MHIQILRQIRWGLKKLTFAYGKGDVEINLKYFVNIPLCLDRKLFSISIRLTGKVSNIIRKYTELIEYRNFLIITLHFVMFALACRIAIAMKITTIIEWKCITENHRNYSEFFIVIDELVILNQLSRLLN